MSFGINSASPGNDPSRITVGVADLQVTNDPSATVVTHALGSCIGVTVFDPVSRVGGMLHFMLPSGRGNEAKAAANPAMFGDTGIPLLFRKCYELGAVKERLVVCAAGGAEVMNDNGQFKIGSRNRTVLRQLFWKNNILLAADETGGNISRTMLLCMADGRVTIRHKGEETALWSA
ncbi:MAG: chemotaxis protein CheD [Phycisphaerales bacterium]|nr:chemotaxis protein CheD [Phycisphaerales bacterium]